MPGEAPQADIAAELKRLRRENEILRQERDILKRATAFSPGVGKSMRFALVDQAKKDFPIHRLCQMLGVSQSGYFAWKDRPASQRQHDDMVMLAHVRSGPITSSNAIDSASGPLSTRPILLHRGVHHDAVASTQPDAD